MACLSFMTDRVKPSSFTSRWKHQVLAMLCAFMIIGIAPPSAAGQPPAKKPATTSSSKQSSINHVKARVKQHKAKSSPVATRSRSSAAPAARQSSRLATKEKLSNKRKRNSESTSASHDTTASTSQPRTKRNRTDPEWNRILDQRGELQKQIVQNSPNALNQAAMLLHSYLFPTNRSQAGNTTDIGISPKYGLTISSTGTGNFPNTVVGRSRIGEFLTTPAGRALLDSSKVKGKHIITIFSGGIGGTKKEHYHAEIKKIFTQHDRDNRGIAITNRPACIRCETALLLHKIPFLRGFTTNKLTDNWTYNNRIQGFIPKLSALEKMKNNDQAVNLRNYAFRIFSADPAATKRQKNHDKRLREKTAQFVKYTRLNFKQRRAGRFNGNVHHVHEGRTRN